MIFRGQDMGGLTHFYVFMLNLPIMICEHYTGIRLGLFTPDQAFDVVAKSQIEKLRKPCLNIIQLVSAELYKVATSGVEKVALV